MRIQIWSSILQPFADDTPKSKQYVELDYKEISRNPDQHEGDFIKFSGKILQVIEDDEVVGFRIATKGNYDNVVFCIYYPPENYSRLLEDDKVNVWAECTGIMSYETVMGSTVTILSFCVERIELQ